MTIACLRGTVLRLELPIAECVIHDCIRQAKRHRHAVAAQSPQQSRKRERQTTYDRLLLEARIGKQGGCCWQLELLLQERLTKIDELSSRLDQSREQVRHLGLENQVLVEMIAAPELSMTSEQAQAQSQA